MLPGHGDFCPADAVDRTLRDRIAAQDAVLRIPPRAFLAVDLLLSDRPLAQARLGAHTRVEEEITQPLVEDEPAGTRVVIPGVADVVAPEMRVEMEEEADGEIGRAEVLGDDFLDVDIAVEIDHILDVQANAELVVLRTDVGDERIQAVAQTAAASRRR